jgi:hypothetical protein
VNDPSERLEAALSGVPAGDQLDEVTKALLEGAVRLGLGDEVPPLDQDPVAAMLGLIADPNVVLSPRAFTTVRRRAGLAPSELASRLRDRGWDVSAADLTRWQSSAPTDLTPALLSAVAEELDVPVASITAEGAARPEWLAALVTTASFVELTGRWARARSLSAPIAASMLESRLLATVNRGERPESEALLASLETYVAAIEDNRRR